LLGKIGADWQFAGLGGFTAGDSCAATNDAHGLDFLTI
jgi:hypothetical protein